jgi:stage III sporulation protein AF
MISWLSSWAQGIIIAVIIATIIEMILPKGSLKKYVKVVIGIYILFTIVSPIINKFSNNKITINDVINTDKYTEKMEESNNKIAKKLSSNNSRTIKDIYIENLETDIKSRLKQKNFEVSNVYIEAEDESPYTIKQMKVYLSSDTKSNKDDKENTIKDNNIENTYQNENGKDKINKVDIQVEQIEITNTTNTSNKNESQKQSNIVNYKKNEIKNYLAEIYSINTDIIYVI